MTDKDGQDTIVTSLNVPRELWELVRAAADANERSISAEIRFALKKAYQPANDAAPAG